MEDDDEVLFLLPTCFSGLSEMVTTSISSSGQTIRNGGIIGVIFHSCDC